METKFRARCPKCGQGIRVPEEKRHVVSRCPICREKFIPDQYSISVARESPGLASTGETLFPSMTAQSTESDIPAPALVSSSHETPSLKIGRFEIREKLGEGGFGIVYRAFDPLALREVALKVPKKSKVDERSLARFLREGRSAGSLQHAGIVQVYEINCENDKFYIASQLIHGRSLRNIIGETTFDQRSAAQLVIKLARALHHAHQSNIIHRDVKPHNILIDEKGEPWLTDFGLAKKLDSDEPPLTNVGSMLGTPAYMSPEQVRGVDVDALSDQYSLGAILYELLTKQRAYPDRPPLVFVRILQEETPDPRELDPTIPPELSLICRKAMSKLKEGRFPSMGAFADALSNWLDGKAADQKKASSSPVRLTSTMSPQRVMWILLAASSLIIVLLISLFAWVMANAGMFTSVGPSQKVTDPRSQNVVATAAVRESAHPPLPTSANPVSPAATIASVPPPPPTEKAVETTSAPAQALVNTVDAQVPPAKQASKEIWTDLPTLQLKRSAMYTSVVLSKDTADSQDKVVSVKELVEKVQGSLVGSQRSKRETSAYRLSRALLADVRIEDERAIFFVVPVDPIKRPDAKDEPNPWLSPLSTVLALSLPIKTKNSPSLMQFQPGDAIEALCEPSDDDGLDGTSFWGTVPTAIKRHGWVEFRRAEGSKEVRLYISPKVVCLGKAGQPETWIHREHGPAQEVVNEQQVRKSFPACVRGIGRLPVDRVRLRVKSVAWDKNRWTLEIPYLQMGAYQASCEIPRLVILFKEPATDIPPGSQWIVTAKVSVDASAGAWPFVAQFGLTGLVPPQDSHLPFRAFNESIGWAQSQNDQKEIDALPKDPMVQPVGWSLNLLGPPEPAPPAS